MRDLELGTLANCARAFTERFGRSFDDVATCFAESNLDKADLKAILGIMGYPFAVSANKQDLKDAVRAAQKLAVYQGHLVPQILQPYTGVSLPTRAVMANASEELVGCLIGALADPSQPPPSFLSCYDRRQFIQEYTGATIALSEFDQDMWTLCPFPSDRRIFLSMFGVPIDKLSMLTGDDLMRLLPMNLPESVQLTRIVTSRVTSERRARMLQLATATTTGHPGSGSPSRQQQPTGNGAPAPPGLRSPIPRSPESHTSPHGPNPFARFMGHSVGQGYPAFTPQPANFPHQASFSGSTAAFPGFTPGIPTPSHVPAGSAGRAQDNGERRSFVDRNGAQIEMSQAELTNLDYPTLADWIARIEGVLSSQVPNIPIQTMVHRIWDSSSTLGFRTLLTRSPDCARLHGYHLTTRSWPDPSLSQIMLVTERAGAPITARYQVDPPTSVFASVTARLVSGDRTIFPNSGEVRYADNLLPPDASEIQILPGPVAAFGPRTVETSTTNPQLNAIAAVSDTISKSQRSAKAGTRILKDEIIDSAFLSLISATPIESGNRAFKHTLHRLLYTQRHSIQCPLPILVQLSRGFSDHDPNHFIPLDTCMDDTTANNMAKVFLKQEHLTEKPYTGKIATLWNNQPETLRAALLSVFKVANALFNYPSDIYDGLILVAERVYKIARALPDRSIENNTYFWYEVLEQVNDVFLGANAGNTTIQTVAAHLRIVPNFTTKADAYQRLSLITAEAYRKQTAGTASHLLLYAKDSVSNHVPSQTVPRVSPPQVRKSPRGHTTPQEHIEEGQPRQPIQRTGLRDRSRGHQPSTDPSRNHGSEQPHPDSPDQNTFDDPECDDDDSPDRSRDCDQDYVAPRGQETQGRRQQEPFFESTELEPVSDISCAQWCAESGCPWGTECRFNHCFPTDDTEARRIRLMVTHKRLTPRRELIELCGDSNQQSTADTPSASITNAEETPSTRPQKRQRFPGRVQGRPRRY